MAFPAGGRTVYMVANSTQSFTIFRKPTYWNAGIHQSVRIQRRRQLMQQVRRLLKQLRCRLLHDVLQHLRLRAWHAVPCLWFSPGQPVTVITNDETVNFFTPCEEQDSNDTNSQDSVLP